MTIECPKCQHENPNDTDFCGKCGTKFDSDLEPTKTLETAVEELRSEVGVILEKNDHGKIPLIRKRLKVRRFPKTKCIVAEFPFRTEFSVYIGIMKVYPVLQSYKLENKYRNTPVMEIYDIPGKRILYIAPVLKKK